MLEELSRDASETQALDVPNQSVPIAGWRALTIHAFLHRTIDSLLVYNLCVAFMAPVVASNHEFMEKLPQEGGKCPPDDAVSQGYEAVWRYVTSDPPTPDDFKSHAAANKPLPPGQDPCRWASCSLFLSDDGSYESLPKPRKRYKYIAKISITTNCGLTKQNGIHVDFWRFKTFKANVQQLFAL